MGETRQNRGACALCGRTMTRGSMARHLGRCPERREAQRKAARGSGKEEPVYHLLARDPWSGTYWLHLEMRGTARLEDLDHYLRGIWLECCGHMSRFAAGGWGSDEVPMRRKASEVFEPGLVLTHTYDFGTETETRIEVKGVRRGRPLSKRPLFLLARNEAPEAPCTECGSPASWICLECVYELEQPGTLCGRCAKAHPHEECGDPVPLVNSPRTGVCGYVGPADPPY